MTLLLDELATRPDDVELLRVYADSLMQQGDPRGDLVVAQLAGGDGYDLIWNVLNPALEARLGMRATYTWRNGFIDAIAFSYHGDEPFVALPPLAAEPAARLLRRFAIDAVQMDGQGHLAPVVAELARLAPAFPCLREIAIVEGMNLGNPWIDGPIRIGDATPLYAAFPRLDLLALDGTDLELGTIDLPTLRHFVATNLEPAQAHAIRTARWQLDSLDLGIGYQPADPCEATLSALLDATGAPELSITAPGGVIAQVVERLPSSRLARTTRRLTIGCRDSFDVDVVDAATEHATWLRSLERVDIRGRRVPVEIRAELDDLLAR